MESILPRRKKRLLSVLLLACPTASRIQSVLSIEIVYLFSGALSRTLRSCPCSACTSKQCTSICITHDCDEENCHWRRQVGGPFVLDCSPLHWVHSIAQSHAFGSYRIDSHMSIQQLTKWTFQWNAPIVCVSALVLAAVVVPFHLAPMCRSNNIRTQPVLFMERTN